MIAQHPKRERQDREI